MNILTAKRKLVSAALSEVGYRAGMGKRNKYAACLDQITGFYNGAKDGFDWCDVFNDYIFVECFGEEVAREMLYQPKKSLGAGCYYSARYFKQNDAFFSAPEVGDQVFFNNYDHTGIVVALTTSGFQTVEGNTGGGNGMVQKKTYDFQDGKTEGFGRPKWDAVKKIKDDENGQEKPDLDEIARAVINGEYGNGAERVKRLEAAGYDPEAVQERVNEILLNITYEVDLTEVAFAVIYGIYGNGADRVKRLEVAGYDPEAVQERVNELLRG